MVRWPAWLKDSTVPLNKVDEDLLLKDEIPKEEKKQTKVTMLQTVNDTFTSELMHRYSSWIKLIRIIAWCQRFRKNCSVTPTGRILSYLTSQNIDTVATTINKFVQQTEFHKELKILRNGKPMKSSSKLLSLSPFLDPEVVLRVGGRLRHANISSDSKHLIIVPKSHPLTTIIVQHFHLKHLHAGPNFC